MAADAHFTPDRADKYFWLQFFHMVAKVLKWVLAHAKLPPGADPAETSQTTGADGPRPLKASQPGISEEVMSAPDPESKVSDCGRIQGSTDVSSVPSGIMGSEPVVGSLSGNRPGADTVLESSSSSDRACGSVPTSARQVLLEPDVLGRLLTFWVVLATRLSKGLPGSCGHASHHSWCVNNGPVLSDRVLLDEVMRIIKSLVGIRQDLLEGVIFGNSFQEMAKELFFNDLDCSVRCEMRDLVVLCAKSSSPAGRSHLLNVRFQACVNL